MNSAFSFDNAVDYLQCHLNSLPDRGRGIRSQWAKAAGCQLAFISHVLNGRYQLSLEQAEAISRHIGHSKEEREYFIILVQRGRSSTVSLKNFFTDMLNERLMHHENIRERMKIQQTLPVEDQAIYYSRWFYSAVHMLLTIPQYQTAAAIEKYLSLSSSQVRECLDFLESRKLIRANKDHYVVEGVFLHVGKDSALYFHQQNIWRQKAIEAINIGREAPHEIHFASVFSLAESDLKKVQEILLTAIESSTEVIRPSKEEKLYGICLDFFEVK